MSLTPFDEKLRVIVAMLMKHMTDKPHFHGYVRVNFDGGNITNFNVFETIRKTDILIGWVDQAMIDQATGKEARQ